MDAVKASAHKRLADEGYEGVLIFSNYSYDDALVGVTDDNRAVYDFDKMVDWLMEETGWDYEDAVEWIEYNTLQARHPDDPKSPVIMYGLAGE